MSHVPRVAKDGTSADSGLENLENRLSAIRGVVQSLPQANFDLLKRVSEHLDR